MTVFYKHYSLNKKGNTMNNRLFLFLAALFTLPLNYVSAEVRYVPDQYSTIQAAMDSAVSGDTILVAPGSYYENVHFRGKGVTLASYFLLYNDTSYISSTVINGSTPTNTDTGSCVLMVQPSIATAGDSSAALIGFTLTGGTGSVFEDLHYPSSYYREGGGIIIQYWSPRIRFNRIINNHVDGELSYPGGGGGAIRCCEGNPIIENNVIMYNSAYCGTAINLYFSSGIVRNNIISGNCGASIYKGGAIYTYKNCLTYPVIIDNNTIVNNSAIETCCGGLRLFSSNDVSVKNNIIWGNNPTQIYRSGGTNVNISYCDVQNGWTGTGNINTDPLFLSNTYQISESSPCIDAGDTSYIYNDPEDQSNPGYAMLPAQGTLRNDMGAFGGPYSALIATAVIGIKSDDRDVKISGFQLFQNYPNPFNPATTISYQLPSPGLVEIRLYNTIGQEIQVLFKGPQTSGTHSIKWNGQDQNGNIVSSGIYIYKIKYMKNNYTMMKSRKMTLIK